MRDTTGKTLARSVLVISKITAAHMITMGGQKDRDRPQEVGGAMPGELI